MAHSVGHGGSVNRGPVVIDQDVKDEIKRLIPLMPLHHPAMLTGIESSQKFLPYTIQRGHSIDTSMGFSPLQGLLMGPEPSTSILASFHI